MIQYFSARSLTRVFVPLVLLGPALGQGVLRVVDDDLVPSPSMLQYDDLPQAIADSSDGDFIAVFSGSYSSFIVDGKDLTIFVPRGEAEVNVEGTATIKNLQATQTVVLRGFNAIFSATQVSLIEDNDGVVWIEDSRFSGATAGLEVVDSASVVLVRSRFLGGLESSPATPAVGLSVTKTEALASSSVATWECQTFGKPGLLPGLSGGDALTVNGAARVFSSGSSFEGGDGADGDSLLSCSSGGAGGDGGHAIRLNDPASQFEFFSPMGSLAGLRGGVGGSAQAPCSPGQSGFLFVGGTVTSVDCTPRTLECEATSPGSGNLDLAVTALAGESFAVWGDTGAIHVPAPAPSCGDIHVLPNFEGPSEIVAQGGTTQYSVPLNPVPAGTATRFFLQSWHYPNPIPSPPLPVTFSSPSVFILFTEAFPVPPGP